jgi:hypothetical protein
LDVVKNESKRIEIPDRAAKYNAIISRTRLIKEGLEQKTEPEKQRCKII